MLAAALAWRLSGQKVLVEFVPAQFVFLLRSLLLEAARAWPLIGRNALGALASM